MGGIGWYGVVLKKGSSFFLREREGSRYESRQCRKASMFKLENCRETDGRTVTWFYVRLENLACMELFEKLVCTCLLVECDL